MIRRSPSPIASTAAMSASYASALNVTPSGDVTGATDVTNIEAAIATAVALDAEGALVTLGRGGPWYINDRITVPQGVDLWGQGSGDIHAPTRIVCTTAGAGIAFGTQTTGGRGGVSGNFTVDGDDVATEPLFIGMTVQRTFVSMESTQSAGEGFVLEATQNCTFVGCSVSQAATIGLVFDYGAAGNRFYNFGIDSVGTWMAVSRQSGTSPAGLHGVPFDNHVHGGIFERVAATGGVWQDKGDGNAVHDVQLVNDDDATFTFISVDEGQFTVDGGLIQSNAGSQGTAFLVASGATLVISGEPVVSGVALVFNNSGTVDLNGFLRVVSADSYLTGTAPREKIAHGYAGLGTVPVFSAGTSGLTQVPATVGASWWRLDPATWPTPPDGRTLQYRVHVVGQGLTAGDVLGGLLYDADGGVGMMAEFTKAADGDSSTEAVSAWETFPATGKSGYVQVRNQTAARGTCPACFIEVRIA